MTLHTRNSIIIASCFAAFTGSVACNTHAATAAAPAAAAGPKFADCSALNSISGNQTNEVNPNDVTECARRGGDSPIKWRPNGGANPGINVGGAGGVYNASTQPPEGSPGARRRPASVDKNKINFACNFPPKISFSGFKPKVSFGACGDFLKGLFSDKNNESATAATAASIGAAAAAAAATAGTSVTDASCPVESDTSGSFGTALSLSKGPTPLVCGGAMPLTSYEVSLNANATYLAGTEHGARYVWIYQNSGGSFQQLGGNAIKLPAYFGTWNAKTKTCDNQVDTPAPIAQMITYNAGASSLVLRVVQSPELQSPSTQEMLGVLSELGSEIDGASAAAVSIIQQSRTNPQANNTSSTTSDGTPAELFLVLPLSGGIPQIPPDCSPPGNYIKAVSPQPDVRIASAAGLCEGTAEQCSLEGISAGAGLSCDVVTLQARGITNTTAGAVDCTGRTQMAVISRPNLIFPPGTTPTVTPIAGRTAMMVTTVADSDIYVPSDTQLTIGANAPSFVLPEGGTMMMKDDSKLVMAPPATILGGSGQALLTNGGQLLRADGTLVTEFPAGATIAASNPILPLSIKANRSISLPAGYMVPTQPNPYVRLPADAPK